MPLDAALTEVIDAHFVGAAPVVAVTDRAGRLLGYITRENIGELMVIRGRS